jgi:hypothetical protein
MLVRIQLPMRPPVAQRQSSVLLSRGPRFRNSLGGLSTSFHWLLEAKLITWFEQSSILWACTAAWPRGEARGCNPCYTGSNPVAASTLGLDRESVLSSKAGVRFLAGVRQLGPFGRVPIL